MSINTESTRLMIRKCLINYGASENQLIKVFIEASKNEAINFWNWRAREEKNIWKLYHRALSSEELYEIFCKDKIINDK